MKVVFLCSGGGGNFSAVHSFLRRSNSPIEVTHVIVDRQCGALNLAEELNVESSGVDLTRNFDDLRHLLSDLSPDIVITNIHRILPKDVIGLPSRFLNLHYSLLPAFKGYIGMRPVVEGRRLGATLIGATCHEVAEVVDSGRIISQGAIPQTASEAEDVEAVFELGWKLLVCGIHIALEIPVPQSNLEISDRAVFSLLNP